MRPSIFLCLVLGCGGSESQPAEGDAATSEVSDAMDTAPVARPVDAVLADYVAAWTEADATKRNAKLEASVTKDVYYADNTPLRATTLGELSKLMGSLITKYRGVRMKKQSGPDAHHERMRFLYRLTDTTDAPISEGLQYIELAADGRFKRIIAHFDPIPAAVMLESAMSSFIAAWTTPDAAKRLDRLRGTLSGAFIDRNAGPLDAEALAKQIDPSVALAVGGFQEFADGFQVAYTRGPNKGVFLGRRDVAGLLAEVSAFEGDPPKP